MHVCVRVHDACIMYVCACLGIYVCMHTRAFVRRYVRLGYFTSPQPFLK